MAKKYYWLKLKENFFKRHDIKIIEAMPNGKEYVLFYLKLLVESVSHEGNLRFSDTIPYNEEMLSVITNTNVDVVRSAMKLFYELKLVDVLDDQTIFMQGVEKMVGSETASAERKRRERERKTLERDNVALLSQNGHTEKEKEKEKEKEQEIETDFFNPHPELREEIRKKIASMKKEELC